MNTVIIFLASYLYLIIIACAGVAFFLSKEKVRLAIMIGIAFPVAYSLAKIFGSLIQSPRPFMVDHVQPLIHAATDNGFPSDHVLLTAAIALIALRCHRRIGMGLCLLTICVGIGRVLAFAHHPIDILGSWVISIVAVSISSVLAQKLTPHTT